MQRRGKEYGKSRRSESRHAGKVFVAPFRRGRKWNRAVKEYWEGEERKMIRVREDRVRKERPLSSKEL